jgi:uncharacterized protein with NRDE domain
MCLLVLAWNAHPKYRLVFAGNRDEFHERPTAPLGWWTGDPAILAGRDLRASGTWLGLARHSRFGVVTNFRDVESPPAPGAPSRGGLVPDFLRDGVSPALFLAGLRSSAARYSGFNLLLGDAASLHYFSNRGDEAPRALAAGVYGLSNHWLDTPWPKLERARAGFVRALGGDAGAEELFAILADRTPAGDAEQTWTGQPEDIERAVSAPFVVHELYGTRCSTVIHVGHDGRTVVSERRFNAHGELTGVSRFQFANDADARPTSADNEPAPDPAFDRTPE